MTWLPGYDIVQLGATGGPYDSTVNPKLCWHTTEGGTLAGAETAYYSYPPHLGVDPWTGERHQYVPLDWRAYSMVGEDAEDSYVIQVEVVGYAAESHTWPASVLEWLGANVAGPVAQATGVPPLHPIFYGKDDGIILASPDSPIRMSLYQWDSFAGHVGHQHAPAPDSHWDPGRLDIASIIAAAAAPAALTAPSSSEDSTVCVITAPGRVDLFVIGTDHGVYQAMGSNFLSLVDAGWRRVGDDTTKGKAVSAAWSPDFKLLYLAVHGTDDLVHVSEWNGQTWSPFVPNNDPHRLCPDPYD